jgi:hypothetical protein
MRKSRNPWLYKPVFSRKSPRDGWLDLIVGMGSLWQLHYASNCNIEVVLFEICVRFSRKRK